MKQFPYLFFLFIATAFASCGNQQREAQLKQVDSLQAELTAIEKQLSNIDTAQANTATKKILADLTFLQENYTDTMPKETAIKLGNYGRHAKLYSKLLESMKGAYKEAEALHIQLDNLEQDITNNKLAEGKFDEFFLAEKRDVGKLKGLAEMNSKAYTNAYKKQEMMESEIEETLAEIKQNRTDSVQQ